MSPGDTAIVATSGAFGDRWIKIVEAYGARAVTVSAEWGRDVDPAGVEKALRAHPQAKAVFCQLTETSTGVVNDVQRYAQLTGASEAVLVVDAISGLGGQDIQTDAWRVDIVVAGSQKGLMTAPGISMASVGPKAWKLIEASKSPRFYFDFRKMKKSLPDHETPWTPPVTLFAALAEAIRHIRAEGLANIFQRHAWLAEATRAAVTALGLELFAKNPCNVLTSVVVPQGVDGKAMIKRLRDDYGVSIAGGQLELAGKIFRLAHMGYMDRFDVLIALSATEMILHQLGARIELGKGVAAAEKVMLSRAKALSNAGPAAAGAKAAVL